MAGGAHLDRSVYWRRRALVLTVLVVLVAAVVALADRVVGDDGPGDDEAAVDDTAPGDDEDGDGAESTTTEPEPDPGPLAEPATSDFETPGLLTFRGNTTRTFYGQGPVPRGPEILWSVPPGGGGLCGPSTVGGETTTWCGTGWTGQPAVFERDGRQWVVFGAYDHKVHFLDGATGEDIIPPFTTGDIIKGSVTIDPDGYPIVYIGSRDNKLRAIAFDRPEPTELWALDAYDVSPTLWNNDWDGAPLIVDGYLFEGGENSQFHVVRLNRSTGPDGLVTMAPELVFNAPGWDDEQRAALTTRVNDMSIENSVAYHDGVVYFANSGGLVQGWDVSGLDDGVTPTRVFRFWAGDDIDASVVVDDEGFLYVAVENERGNARSAEVGQLLKLDPRSDDPVVWSIADSRGFWATPALYGELLVIPSDGGTVFGVERATGEVWWTFELPPPTWQSPVIVDDMMVLGDCSGVLHGYEFEDLRTAPVEAWRVELTGCIESTPALWDGRLFVGARGGRFYAIGDPGSDDAAG